MKTSYVYQIVNVVGGVALLVVLLRYFTKDQFVEWSLFTTLGGFTIQLESALSTVCSRLLVRVHHASGVRAFQLAIRQCRRWYRVFAASVFLALCVGGLAYFARTAAAGFTGTWVLEWVVFAAGYLATFGFAYNCSLLIATEHVTIYSLINMASRIINVTLSCVLTVMGSGVLGLAGSFMLCGALGGLAMQWAGRKAIGSEEGVGAQPQELSADHETLDLRHVVLSFIFILSSYGLYRSGLLIDAGSSFEADVQASYGLALQIFSLLMTLSSVPINMLVAPLQRAVLGAEPASIAHEMARLAVYANLVFCTALAGLVWLGPFVFHAIASRASLPHTSELLSLGFGFLLELNILLLVNVSMASRSYRFVLLYGISAALGLAVGTALRMHGAGLYLAFGLVPALVQLSVAAPLIFKEVSRLTGVGARRYARAFAMFLWEILRHPVGSGLAIK